MNFSKIVFLGILIAATAACASNGERTGTVEARVTEGAADRTADASDAKKDDMVCRREHQVGSNFKRTVCRSRAEIERDRSDGQEALRLQRQRNAASRVTQGANN